MVKQSRSDYFGNAKKITAEIKTANQKENFTEAFVDFVNQNILERENWTFWLSIRLREPSRDFETEKDKELYLLRKRRSTDVEYAKRSFKHFFSYLNEEFQTFYEKYLNAFVFYEKNGYDRGIHIHALIDRIDSTHLDLLQQKCNEEFGDTLIKPFHSGVARYLAKKYAWDTLVDFDFYRINSRRRRQKIMPELIWFWSRGFYKVYVDDYRLKEKINDWKDSKLHCQYFLPNGKKAWDFIIPSKYYNRVAKELRLPSKVKNGNRVEAGKRAQEIQRYPIRTQVKSLNLSSGGLKDQDTYQSILS